MIGRTTLGTVIERLGLTLLTARAGSVDRARPVDSVVLYDVTDPPRIPAGAVVLGVGVQGPDAIATLLGELTAQEAAALIVREPVEVSEEIDQRAAQGRIALLELVRGASWMQVARMLDDRPVEFDGLAPASAADTLDLFEVANSLSALLTTPVTIEDVSSRIVAFSADQADADEARKASVLGHQVPPRYNEPMVEAGIFRQLYAATAPIFVPSLVRGVRPRAAMPIRAGDEVLGSIWAIVDEPLGESRGLAMVEAASTAAIAMLRSRVAADASRQLRAAVVGNLIDGGHAAVVTAGRMQGNISGGCVLAAGLRDHGIPDSAATSAELDRLAGAWRMLLHSEIPAAVAAVVDETAYAVVPAYDGKPPDLGQLRRLAEEFARRAGRECDQVVVSIGGPVADTADLDRSRREADLTLRVLRSSAHPPVRVALAEELQVQSLMLQLSDLMARERSTLAGPIAGLRRYDGQHQTALEATLRAWLDHFGDVGAAAVALHVHKNTFRYRLGRVVEITGVDLSDPEERFRLMLQFRLRTDFVR